MVSESVSENIVIHPFDERARLLAFVLNHLRGDYVHFVQPDAERQAYLRVAHRSPSMAQLDAPCARLRLSLAMFRKITFLSPIVPWIRLPVETSRWYAVSLNCNVMFIMLC